MTVTGRLLNGAADIYLIVSVALLLLQRAIVTKQFAYLMRSIERWRLGDDIVALDDVEQLSGCGNKAYRLGVMRTNGFPVPEGIVLTARFLEKFKNADNGWRSRKLDRVCRSLAAKSLAVRSSGSAEDNGTNSFAGVFSSVLHVDRSRLESAVSEVLSSFSSAVVDGYGVENAQPNILIQRMIEPTYSGVLFTQDPACLGHSLVEMVEGTAEKLVSGTVAPMSCRIGRVSRELLADVSPPLDLTPLIDIGHRLEALFEHPQDIEWTYLNGRFYIVQSRDITTSSDAQPDQSVKIEWSHLLGLATSSTPDGIAFEQNELSEVLPRPSRLSLSLMESMWSSGGSIDLACRKIGIGYRVEEDSAPYLATIFGNLYVNEAEELARAPKLNSLATWRLNKLARTVENDFSDGFLPQFLREISILEAVDFDRLSTSDLLEAVARIRTNYVESTGVVTSVINIVADFHLKGAKAKLAAAGLEPARYLVRLNQTEFEKAIAEARKCPPRSRGAFLLRGVGHRSPIDYELAEPRYAERMSGLAALLQTPTAITRSAAELKAELLGKSRDLRLVDTVVAACSLQTLKEDAKHHSLRELAVLRNALQAVDRRFGLSGSVFTLTFEEIAKLADNENIAGLRSLASVRQQPQAASVASLGPTLTVRQIESYASGLSLDTPSATGQMSGLRVSGSGVVEGRARVVSADNMAAMSVIADFADGDIVVSRMVPTTSISIFPAGRRICLRSWRLARHTAIVAREFNVPLIVQAKGLQAIETGMLVRLHQDGTVEIVQSALSVAAE